jgi:hypothetical protein
VKRAYVAAALAVLAAPRAIAGKPPAPALPREHTHPAGVFSVRTPEAWTFAAVAGRPDLFEARGDDLIVRFLWQDGEAGFDSLHVSCMLERLRGPMDTDARVKYEYDFLSGMLGARRVLESAFVVRYDEAVAGHREWRQRNLTIVGEGQSLCVIAHAPAALWKKPASRALLDAVVSGLTLRSRQHRR